MRTVVERLRRKQRLSPVTGGGTIGIDANRKTFSSSYVTDDGMRLVNPDGPEAVALIEELVEALEKARVDILVTLGACRDSMSPDAVEVFQNIAKRCENAAALAKAHHPEEVLK
jgi:uncharacterized membrane protein